MSIIRGAAADHPVEKWYSYDQQFRLRVSRAHTEKWSSIDVFLWLRILTNNTQKQQQANVGYKCYNFDFKDFCNKKVVYSSNIKKLILEHKFTAILYVIF